MKNSKKLIPKFSQFFWMARILFCIIIFEIFGCKDNTPVESCGDRLYKYSEISKNVNKKNDTAMLVKTLTNMINKDSSCKDIYLTRGDILLAIDSFNLARKDFRKTLLMDSNNIYALYKLGFSYQLEELYDSSISYFQKALSKKSYENTIIDYHSSDSNLADEIAKYDVEYSKIIFRQGEAYYYKGNLRSALINFNFCIDNNFLLAKSYLYRGSIYLESNRKEKACEDFKVAFKKNNLEAEIFIRKYCK